MSRKKVDFLIRYEHKVRELETIMLLRLELERRGFSVAFVANYDYKQRIQYDPRVIISPAIYSDENVIGEIANYGFKRKICNLLWEQLIGKKDEEDPNCTHNVKGLGRKAVTLCWGEQTRRRIVRGGVPIKKALVVGQLNTDLLRMPFRENLLSKDILAERYKLDSNKRWNLFISSFAYCELDDLQRELCLKAVGEEDFEYMTQVSNDSRSEILQWFEKVLQIYPNDIFIYRPHPDEARKSKVLKDMERIYPNFRVISELALKHWINASEKIYNWYSTGLVDAVVLGKPFRLLRPIKIREEDDYRIYFDAVQIRTEADFLSDYPSILQHEIVDDSLFNSYYYIPERYVYQEVCDILQEMLETDNYDIHYSISEYFKFGKVRLSLFMRKMLRPFKPVLRYLPIIRQRLSAQDAYLEILKQGYEKNVATQEDIDGIASRIKPILYGYQV